MFDIGESELGKLVELGEKGALCELGTQAIRALTEYRKQTPLSLSTQFKEDKDTLILIYFVKVNKDSQQRYIQNPYQTLSTSYLKQDKDTNSLSIG